MGDLPDRLTSTTVEYKGVAYTPICKQLTVTSSGSHTVWTPSSGKSVVVTDIIVSTDTKMTVTVKDNQSTPVTYIKAHLADNGGFVMNLVTPIKLPQDTSLVLETSASGTVSITVCGREE